MSKPLKTATIAAPGFYGLNTQESGITLNAGFALEATNCIIDKFGRIGSRKGWTKVSNPAVASISAITQANPCEITAYSHGFETGEEVTITFNYDGTDEGMDELNDNTYAITVVDVDTFTLDGVDSSAFTEYVRGGVATEVSDITGAVRAIAEYTKADGTFETLLTADSKLWKLDDSSDPLELTSVVATITGATQADPCSITATGHNLTTGNEVAITNVVGMTELNGNTYTVTVVDDDTFTINTDSSAFTAYTSGGVATKTAITITGDDWQIITYNNYAVFVQQGHTMVYYDGSNDNYNEYSSAPGSTTPSCGAACFNRVWVADDYKVYWSKILEPQSFSGVGTGFLDIREIFGEDDTVTAITSYNNRLVIFGKRNIAFFAGAEDPTGSTFQMVDHIKGIGCTARDSVQNAGSEVVFLSADGVRTLGRTIQEVSSPIGDVSRNVRDEIVLYAQGEVADRIKGVFSQENAFYLLTLPSTGFTYCFDMRGALEGGARRVTKWTNINPTAYAVRNNEDLLVGQNGYVGRYNGYADDTTTYRMSYYTNYFDFGDATVESLLKKIRLAIIGSTQQDCALKWAFDYDTDYRSLSFTLSEGITSEYNVDEYFSDDDTDNEAEYSTGTVLDNISLNIGGRGAVIQIGVEADITGGALSLQKMDIFAKDGKLIS